ncbi:DUF4136 domain-containing protein [Cellvibrio sp. PSBB023]|uniref:DUF4136 domain-containing protein n=1 Tax=Cellvibrio sp. PSBB023 TaxID=1945512 RepID=UPI00098ECE15|nr:DUF4136 domain-containing protein [Cellvibrio sp. PSBB023]AQT60086.1 hypothetical protein B0D95_08265 [Cellvibrio sp. PSBB023]
MMTLSTGLIKVTRFTMLLALLSAILSSCSSIKYREMQAASPELKGLKTYHWERPALDAASGANAQQFDATFRAEIDKGMAIKGYVYSADNAQLLLDYRIAVVTRPGIEEPNYGPHWIRDDTGNFRFTGWEDPQGASNLLEHGIITISMRATRTEHLLWEGGASKLLTSGVEQTNPVSAAKTAASVLLHRIPAPR